MTKVSLSETPVQITTVVSEMFAENAFIVHLKDRNDCIVIDPSFDTDSILQYLTKNNLTVSAILNTHGHTDHIVGNKAMKLQFPDAPLVIGVDDAAKLTDPELNLSASYGLGIVSPPADRTVVHGEIIEFAGFRLETRNTPGHSCGHVVWICHDTTPTVAINGDVLFAGSVGRTDFPDGNFDDLELSIRQQLYTLPADTLVLTGHGNPTTIGHEKQYNPFVTE
jgi:glyoxylase-like metal-dependent hydrolase (beta-lactamase superfamily II)|tara:strand:- start:1429 stop:2097 length:669 start_codon:yes stop_codon:yes gene_type:complete